jgi:hypothetical protein
VLLSLFWLYLRLQSSRKALSVRGAMRAAFTSVEHGRQRYASAVFAAQSSYPLKSENAIPLGQPSGNAWPLPGMPALYAAIIVGFATISHQRVLVLCVNDRAS